MDQPLYHEAAVFANHIDEWRKVHLGQVVLIKGDDVIGFYPSLEEAFREGTSRFGLEPFLVRQIVPTDVVNVSFYGRRLHVT
jgi:hypothetical protein